MVSGFLKYVVIVCIFMLIVIISLLVKDLVYEYLDNKNKKKKDKFVYDRIVNYPIYKRYYTNEYNCPNMDLRKRFAYMNADPAHDQRICDQKAFNDLGSPFVNNELWQ